MKLLLIHLSDLHIKGPLDPVLTRREKIIDAVKNLDYGVDLCVVAVTGDIAFSGKEIEYFYAWDLIDGIVKGLEKHLPTSAKPIPVFCVAIPGNHDCDFDQLSGARDIFLDGVLKSPAQARDASVLDYCIKPQTSFFEFLDVYAKAGRVEIKNSSYGEKLYYEYQFGINGNAIRLLCCNTAWLSRLPDIQGRLLFPPDAIPNSPEPFLFTVALFHHLYPWLEAN